MKINKKVTRRFIDLVLIILCLLAVANSFTFGLNFTATKKRPKPKDARIAERLKAHVHKLSEEIGERNLDHYPKLEQAAEYIARKLEYYDYTVKFQEYFLEGKAVKNIVARKKGSVLPDGIIVVGAHYDTVATPGADDNASGVAVVLELARILVNSPTSRSIEFCFFTCEEDPFFKTELMGSRLFVRLARAEAKNIRYAVIFDMVGYYTDKMNSQRYFPLITGLFLPNRGNFISVFSNSRSSGLSSFLIKSFQRNSRFPIVLLATNFDPTIDFSDHWAFWKEGYPTVMVSDTSSLRNNKYHTNADTWDTLDFDSMACVVEGFSVSLLELANRKQ
ncbi:MAG: M28 family peptidase [Candidatus Omnitrophica bacterium]|nr:M28 family peptidase [Candidatus Omnitrophota bacterium]